MTALTPAEISSAESIAALLVGQRPRTIANAYSAVLNRTLAGLLLAGWPIGEYQEIARSHSASGC